MKKWYWLYISIIVAALLYIILLSFDPSGNPQDALKGKDVVAVMKSVSQWMDFWDIVKRGMLEAARESGMQIRFTGPPHEREVDMQIQMLYDVIESEPDLIILAAGDFNRLRIPVEYADSKGIPVVAFDSAVDSPIPVSFVATDNVAAGIKASGAMEQILAAQGGTDVRLMIISHIPGTATAIDRERGVREGGVNLPIVDTWFCNNDAAIASELAVKAINELGINAFIALNEISTIGVADAIHSLGLEHVVPVVGFDNAIKELAYVENGVLDAIVVQRPFDMGYQAVKMAELRLLGKQPHSVVDTGSIVITKDNMFDQEFQQVLFPYDNP